MSTRRAVPEQYAYKEEGRDVDDGIEDYEATEQQLAEETLRHLERGVEEADFSIALPAAQSSGTRVVQALLRQRGNPAAPTENDEAEIAALLQELRQQLNLLVIPSTAREIQDTVIRLKFCTHVTFLLLLHAEGRSYHNHPVLEIVTELLPKVRALKAITLTKKKIQRGGRTAKKSAALLQQEEADEDRDDSRQKISAEMMNNRGLTRTRPKDRKNPRVNQKRKYKKGVRKVRNVVKQHRPEAVGGFQGVDAIRTHVTKSRNLS